MEDDTTTNAAMQDDQALEGQPVEQTAEAVTTTPDSEPQSTDQPAEEPAPQAADNSTDDASKTVTAEWLQNKGLDPSIMEDPEKLKLANMAYNQEKLMTKSRQQASELQKQLGTQPLEQRSDDPLMQEALERAARAETIVTVNEWKSQKGITADQDQAMGAYIQANPDKGYLLKNGYLSLDDIYAMSGVGSQDPSTLKAQGKQEALESLAIKQRATAPTGNAVSSAPPTAVTSANVEKWWESLGPAGRQDPENRKKLDSLL